MGERAIFSFIPTPYDERVLENINPTFPSVFSSTTSFVFCPFSRELNFFVTKEKIYIKQIRSLFQSLLFIFGIRVYFGNISHENI